MRKERKQSRTEKNLRRLPSSLPPRELPWATIDSSSTTSRNRGETKAKQRKGERTRGRAEKRVRKTQKKEPPTTLSSPVRHRHRQRLHHRQRPKKKHRSRRTETMRRRKHRKTERKTKKNHCLESPVRSTILPQHRHRYQVSFFSFVVLGCSTVLREQY